MSNSRGPNTLSLSQIFVAAFWIFSIFVLVVLVQKVSTTADLLQQRDALQQQMKDVQDEQRRLVDRKQHVQSNEYVEEVARHDMKLGKPGETAVIAAPVSTPLPAR
ncbi:MAG: cell division protein FtsL [Chloroflexi bacterium]|nr:cell division protein FtsL [Chloroflexota bacterium]